MRGVLPHKSVPMIHVSMLKFVRTRDLGPLRVGMTRGELREVLGTPELWGTQQTVDRADIWRYGDIEYHFDNSTVSFIFSDQENLTDGGSTLKIDPWMHESRRTRPMAMENQTR